MEIFNAHQSLVEWSDSRDMQTWRQQLHGNLSHPTVCKSQTETESYPDNDIYIQYTWWNWTGVCHYTLKKTTSSRNPAQN